MSVRFNLETLIVFGWVSYTILKTLDIYYVMKVLIMMMGEMSAMPGISGRGASMQMPPLMIDKMMKDTPYIYHELEKTMYMYSAVCILPLLYFQKYLHARQTR